VKIIFHTHILFTAVEERRLRTLHVTQIHTRNRARDLIGTDGGRALLMVPKRYAGVVHAEKSNHVVLIQAVAGHTDAADQHAIAIYRHTAGKICAPLGQRGMSAVATDIAPRRSHKSHAGRAAAATRSSCRPSANGLQLANGLLKVHSHCRRCHQEKWPR